MCNLGDSCSFDFRPIHRGVPFIFLNASAFFHPLMHFIPVVLFLVPNVVATLPKLTQQKRSGT